MGTARAGLAALGCTQILANDFAAPSSDLCLNDGSNESAGAGNVGATPLPVREDASGSSSAGSAGGASGEPGAAGSAAAGAAGGSAGSGGARDAGGTGAPASDAGTGPDAN